MILVAIAEGFKDILHEWIRAIAIILQVCIMTFLMSLFGADFARHAQLVHTGSLLEREDYGYLRYATTGRCDVVLNDEQKQLILERLSPGSGGVAFVPGPYSAAAPVILAFGDLSVAGILPDRGFTGAAVVAGVDAGLTVGAEVMVGQSMRKITHVFSRKAGYLDPAADYQSLDAAVLVVVPHTDIESVTSRFTAREWFSLAQKTLARGRPDREIRLSTGLSTKNCVLFPEGFRDKTQTRYMRDLGLARVALIMHMSLTVGILIGVWGSLRVILTRRRTSYVVHRIYGAWDIFLALRVGVLVMVLWVLPVTVAIASIAGFVRSGPPLMAQSLWVLEIGAVALGVVAVVCSTQRLLGQTLMIGGMRK